MRITIADTRTLAVAIIQPAVDKFYNYTTGGWEQPFNAANHLKPLTPLEAAPSVFSGILTADVSGIMVERTDVAAVVMTVDPTGNPIATIDVWTLPYPVSDPTRGGWSR
jgi:hypothetical protein